MIRLLLHNRLQLSITIALGAIVMLLLLSSCQKDKVDYAPSFTNKDSIPMMDTKKMSMLISDSGITRYKVEADRWLVFDRERDPYWFFPEGIYLEQFDTLFNVEASVRSDTAYYYVDAKLWELRGNINIMNRNGEYFWGEELFWNEKAHHIYSEKLVQIKSNDSFVWGYGFESDQTMTEYHIRQPHQGEIYIQKEEPVGKDRIE